MKEKINNIALLRVDADFYQSTLDVLTHLYPKISENGICIIDDYGGFSLNVKKQLMNTVNNIKLTSLIESVDGTCYYWIVKKPSSNSIER